MSSFYASVKKELACEYPNLSLWYFVSFLYGCTYCFSFSIPVGLDFLFSLFFCLVGLLLLARHSFFQRSFLLFVLAFILGICSGVLKKNNSRSITVPDNFCVFVQGEIAQMTKIEKGVRVLLTEVQSLDRPSYKFEGRVRVNIRDKYFSKLDVGDVINVRACLMPPPKKVIPEGYDFSFYANLSNISAVGYSISAPKVISSTTNFWMSLRKKIYERLLLQADPVAANFIAALVIGDNRGLSKEILQNMRLAGISHILCISGLHLSLVTLMCFRGLRFCLNSSNYLAYHSNIKLISGVVSIIFGYGYLKLSGGQVAATRAFIMCALATMSVILQRSYHPLRAVGVASFMILIFNPEYSLHPSFQLSFLAVLSLIAGYNFYLKRISRIGGLWGRAKAEVISNLYTSALVGFATGPIVMYHFHIFSNYATFANIVAVPIVTFILMPCCFIFLLSIPFDFDIYVLKLMSCFINIIIKTADVVVKLPYSVINTGHISGYSFAVYVFGFFWIIIWRSRISYFGFVIIGIAVFMMLNTKYPDFILDTKLKIIGVKNKDDKLEVYGYYNKPKYTAEYWSLWFGQREVLEYFVGERDQNLSFVTKQNKFIDVVFNNLDCNTSADITLNYSSQFCAHEKIVNINDSIDKSFVFVFCDTASCYAKIYP